MIDFFCATLRREPVAWPAGPSGDGAAVLERARDHGVHLLVAERLGQPDAPEGCLEPTRALFARVLREEAAVEQITRRELREVLGRFGDEGVRPLLFKGAALAFTHYPRPVLRPRLDADLLVTAADVPRAAAVLGRLGYEPVPSITGTLVSYQQEYSKVDRFDIRHSLDLHWRMSNPQLFARIATAEDLAARSVSVPALGETARALGPVDALAVACIHRVAHHHDEERLIWLYDIHLLAGALTGAEAEAFLAQAASAQIRAVCARGCALAQARFGTELPPDFLDRLARGAEGEPSAEYLRGDRRRVDVLLSDLRTLGGWTERFRLLGEHVFPPASYMRQVYGVTNRGLLPVLYARRVAAGARKWFRRGGRPGP